MVGPELAKIAWEAAMEQSRLSTARIDGALPLFAAATHHAWLNPGLGNRKVGEGPSGIGIHGRCTANGGRFGRMRFRQSAVRTITSMTLAPTQSWGCGRGWGRLDFVRTIMAAPASCPVSRGGSS